MDGQGVSKISEVYMRISDANTNDSKNKHRYGRGDTRSEKSSTKKGRR